MRKTLFLLALLISINSYSQGLFDTIQSNLTVDFFNHKPLNLHPYKNRAVPNFEKYPYYVSISFPYSEINQIEYFRIDTSHYLKQEYFKTKKENGSISFKSKGVVRVTDTIFGRLKHIVPKRKDDSPFGAYYGAYKELAKEGEWLEYEDSLYDCIYWKGNYLNNKKVGLWSKFLFNSNDDFLLEQVDFDKNSKKIYTKNLIYDLSFDSLKEKLLGKWLQNDCESKKVKRFSSNKFIIIDSIENYNNELPDQTYLEFKSKSKFERKIADGCNKYKSECLLGIWTLYKVENEIFIKLIFNEKEVWRYKVLYLDYDNNLIIERQ